MCPKLFIYQSSLSYFFDIILYFAINNNLEKYWVTSPTKLESVKDKQKQSMIEKYGDNYSILQLDKRKKTLIKK